MERTGSQKALFVLSILSVIFGGLGVILALLALLGGIGLGLLTPEQLAEVGLSNRGAGKATAILTTISIIALLSSAFSLLIGILGIRAAKDNSKIMPVWVLALIDLIFTIISTVVSLLNGASFDEIISFIFGIIFSAIIFALANNIKKQAGK